MLRKSKAAAVNCFTSIILYRILKRRNTYARGTRSLRNLSQGLRDRQLHKGRRGAELHAVRHQPDDGGARGGARRAAVRAGEEGCRPDRQRTAAHPLHPRNGKSEGKAAPGGLQHQQQGRGQTAHRQLFERDGDVAAARRAFFQGELSAGRGADLRRQLRRDT